MPCRGGSGAEGGEDTSDEEEAEPTEVTVGSKAVIQGMLSAAGMQWNGSVVEVQSWSEQSERFVVKLDDGTQKAIKLKNLVRWKDEKASEPQAEPAPAGAPAAVAEPGGDPA